MIRDHDLEEKLTDLTCVYLGFGAFSLPASDSVETGGVSSAGEKLLYERRSLGYLSPAQFALLLGVQLAVRADEHEQRAVCSELSANHAALVKDALGTFAGQVRPLRERLSVPEVSEWPPRRALASLPVLPDDEDNEDDESDDAHGTVTRELDHPERFSREQDFGILSTANQLDDRPENYRRFAVILDRRFAEWKAVRASEAAP